MSYRTAAAAAALLFTASALAANDAPPPPPLPETVPADAPSDLEPQVTIIERGGDLIEEYRSGGRLYMVKITPANGVPYYLIDSDGDGSLETLRNDLDNPPVVQWRVLTW